MTFEKIQWDIIHSQQSHRSFSDNRILHLNNEITWPG